MSNETNGAEAPKKSNGVIVPCVAMACLTAIELFALSKGINGTLQVLVMCTISGIAGFGAHKLLPVAKKE